MIDPCYLGENVVIRNSVIGPHLSVGNNTVINNSVIKNCIIQRNSSLNTVNLQNSMIGNHVDYKGQISEVNMGDYTQIV